MGLQDLFKNRISMDTMLSWFDKLSEEEMELMALFNIQEADGNLITIQKRFKAKFYGLTPRYFEDESEIAYIKFREVIRDNLFKLLQLDKYQNHGLIKDLGNFELYQDEHITNYDSNTNSTSNSTNNTNTTNSHERNLIEGSLVGSSDSATMGTMRDKTRKAIETKGIIEKSNNKIMDYLDPNTRQMTHTVSVYGGGDKSTINGVNTGNTVGTNVLKGSSKVTMSNPFRDRIAYLKLEVPNLANEFLEKFRIPLFLW